MAYIISSLITVTPRDGDQPPVTLEGPGIVADAPTLTEGQIRVALADAEAYNFLTDAGASIAEAMALTEAAPVKPKLKIVKD